MVAWMVGLPLWLLPDKMDDRRSTAEQVELAGKIGTRQAYQQWLATRDKTTASNRVLITNQKEQQPPIWSELYAKTALLYNKVWGNSVLRSIKPVLFRVFGGATYFLFRDVDHRLEETPYSHLLKDLAEEFSLIVLLEMPHNAHISRVDGLLQGIEKQLRTFSPYIKGIITQSYSRYGLIQVLLKQDYKTSGIPWADENCLQNASQNRSYFCSTFARSCF